MIDCAAASYALSQIKKREKVPTEMGAPRSSFEATIEKRRSSEDQRQNCRKSSVVARSHWRTNVLKGRQTNVRDAELPPELSSPLVRF